MSYGVIHKYRLIHSSHHSLSSSKSSQLTLLSQPHKMVKHTQTILRLWPTNCLSVSDHFMRSELKGLIILRLSVNGLQSVKVTLENVLDDY